ncbi:MAG: threonine ammonia-lyase [Alphaproteobacteria bacterium]|nr:threonine ammonia-lyase [Alphaproteobacteria bacterium]
MSVSFEDIRKAAELLQGQIVATPTVASRTLSDITGAELSLKFENLQYTGSFKDRGALVKLSSLSAAERERGIIAVSAGNHAQGVAYHAGRLGIPATIVMPRATPFNKVRSVHRFGACTALHGDGLSEAAEEAHRREKADKLAFIHPFDDEQIIAGQGTVALEMLATAPDLDVVVVPVGGGGLISGCAIAAKAIKPTIEVIGVESELYPCMFQAVHGLELKASGHSIAEGIAVKSPGKLTRAIVESLVDDLLLVGESALEDAVQLLIEIEKTVAEGAGGAALAAIRANPERFAGRKVGLIISGGNIDARLLSNILVRGLVRDGRLVKIRVEISDQPGALAQVSEILGKLGGNIVEVYHQRMFYDVPVKLAELDVVVETRDIEHAQAIVSALEEEGYPTRMMKATEAEGT